MLRVLGDSVTVGVDIGARTLRAVALRQLGGSYELIAAAESVRAPNHPVPTQLDVERLAQAIERQGYVVRDVVLGAPSDRLAGAIIELPPRSSGAPIETLAKAELSKTVQGELEAFVWDLPPSRRARASEYLAIGLPHATAHELMAPFTKAGLDVVAIEPESSALQRITGANGRVVFDAGARGVRVYAFEGEATLFVRNVELGGDTIDSDRVRTSLSGTIDYIAERFPSLEEASLIVLGEERQSERLSEFLLSEYETTIVREPLIDVRLPSWLADAPLGARWATALGLAARTARLEVAA